MWTQLSAKLSHSLSENQFHFQYIALFVTLGVNRQVYCKALPAVYCGQVHVNTSTHNAMIAALLVDFCKFQKQDRGPFVASLNL